MRVLLLGIHDWAGMGDLLTHSLQRVDVDAKLYISGGNHYKHPRFSINKSQAMKFAKTCDIIQYMHSEKVALKIDLSKKKVAVFHGGGKFRYNSQKICRIFNPIVDCSIIQTCDLFGLGAKNEQWILPPIDIEKIKPLYRTKGKKIIVGHYPSSPIGKGSSNIQNIIENIRGEVPNFEYRFDYNKVPWRQQIKRMGSVDIYVERMSLGQSRVKQNKQVWYKTGVWGITALEAAALGKVVVTNFLGHNRYKKEYGNCLLQIANSKADMEKVLIKLLSKPKGDLLNLKQDTRRWVEKYHSFEAIGRRLKKIYERI